MSDDLNLVTGPALTRWLASVGLTGEMTDVRLLTGGTQNVLARFTLDGRHLVLRRPPRHPRPGNDAAMLREARVLGALASTTVPHPRLVAACEDTDVLGVAFFVMENVEGYAATDQVPDQVVADPLTQQRLGHGIVEALASLAAVDHVAAGLGDLSRTREDWLPRQVERWSRQLASYADVEGYPGVDLPGIDALRDWLLAHMPQHWNPGLIHGDFHFGNVLFDPRGQVSAVVDWELAAIGDPLLDLGHLLATWPDPDEPRTRGLAHELPALGERRDVIEHYARISPRGVEDVAWFHALACFRLASILEGTHARAAAGQADAATGERLHGIAGAVVDQALAAIDTPH